MPPPWSRELEEDDEDEDVVVEVEAMDERVEEGRYARRGNLLKIVEGDEQACVEGFNRACDAGPLAEEPLHGVRVTVIKASGEDQEALASKVRRRIRQAILRRGARVWEPLVEGDVLCSQNALGKLHGLLSKRRGTIREEDVISNELWCLRAQLPAASALGFGEALLEWTSGGASVPQLIPAGFQLLDEDPFWAPTTEDEREEHGDFGGDVFASSNVARALVNAVRRRKGLASDERVLRAKAEAQKSNQRIRA